MEFLLSGILQDLKISHVIPATISLDEDVLWKSVRKLTTNKGALTIVTILEKKPCAFGELKKKTLFDSNDINHALIGLKDCGLVIQKEDKIYYLTKYCQIILNALRNIIYEISAAYDEDSEQKPNEDNVG